MKAIYTNQISGYDRTNIDTHILFLPSVPKKRSWGTRLICAVDQKTARYDLVSWGKHFWTIFLEETFQNLMFYLLVCLSLWYLNLDFPLKILKIGLLFCGSPGRWKIFNSHRLVEIKLCIMACQVLSSKFCNTSWGICLTISEGHI